MSRRRDTKSVQRENSRLKKKVQQLESAIKALSDDQKTPLPKKRTPKITQRACPQCRDDIVKILDLGRFRIECCESCTYRHRVVGGH